MKNFKKSVIQRRHLSGRTVPILDANGFTLIELMIVITILGILISVAAPSYKSATVTAGEAALKKDLFIMRDVIDQYYADHGKYPPALHDLVDAGYIRNIPKDPFTQSADTWVEIPAEENEGGVYDVHSGSDLVGLDGTPYNIW
ncbi:MAG: type II secretion system protein [Nitrospiria bacterium]